MLQLTERINAMTGAAGTAAAPRTQAQGAKRKRGSQIQRLRLRSGAGCVYCKSTAHTVAFCPVAPPRRHSAAPDWPPGIYTNRAGDRRPTTTK